MKNRSSRSSKRGPDRVRQLDAGLAVEPDEHHEFFSEGESANFSRWPGQDSVALEEVVPELVVPRLVRTPEMNARRDKFKKWVLVLLLLLIPIGAGALWQQARSSQVVLAASSDENQAPQRTVAVSGAKPEGSPRGASEIVPGIPQVQTPTPEAVLAKESPASEALVPAESQSAAPGSTTSSASPVPSARARKAHRFMMPPMMRPVLPGTPPTVAYPVN